MSAPSATRILVLCDGASIPPPLSAKGWDHTLAINAEGPKPSLNLKVENLSGKVLTSLDNRAQDLIRIASCCYGADQMVSRGGNDIHREHWRRVFCLAIPVIDRVFWSDPATIDALVECLGFGTEDTWWFHFTERDFGIAQMRLALNDDPWFGTPDTVMLYSGGTDSLCALVEAVAEHGLRPLVVSHRPAGHIDHWQKELLAEVRSRFPGWGFPHMSFWIHKKQTRASAVSQRTRGFLFAALGAAVAGQIGVGRVLLPDNGYVSINPPISGQLVGSLASRGTHPAFIRLFNILVGRVFPREVLVGNPLEDRTRAEAMRVLARTGVPHLLGLTHTCGKHQQRTNAQPHCGGCSQCVDRRFSAIAAGLEAHDPAGSYVIDIFRDEIPEGEARTIVLAYVDFARRTEQATPDELFLTFEELVATLDPNDPNFAISPNRIVKLLNRHGEEVVQVLAGRVGDVRYDIARGSSEGLHLLALLGPHTSEQQVPDPVPTTDRDSSGRNDASRLNSKEDDWNEWRQRTGVWHITFHGEKATIPHRKGMTQLALLLQSPRQPLDVLALARCEAVAVSRDAVLEGFANGFGRNLGEVLSDDSIEILKARKRELPAEIQSARARGRHELVKALTEDLRVTKRELNRAFGLGRRRRLHDGPSEKARKTVSKNIHECFDLIDVDLEVCREHLVISLDLGVPPEYRPDPPEDWVIGF